MAWRSALFAACLAALPFQALSQNSGGLAGPIQTSIVVLDQEQLFDESLFGERFRAELLAESAALSEENNRIEAELIAEERALTERRSDMSPAEFRAEADAFDARVTQIRREQDAKARSLTQREAAERQVFFQAVAPILGQLLRSYGAVAILDRRSVLVSDDRIDITDAAIEQIDAVLGDGAQGLLDPTSPTSPPTPTDGD